MKKYIFSILLPFALLALQSCDLKDSFKETLYDNSIEGDVWYADDDINLTYSHHNVPGDPKKSDDITITL